MVGVNWQNAVNQSALKPKSSPSIRAEKAGRGATSGGGGGVVVVLGEAEPVAEDWWQAVVLAGVSAAITSSAD